MSLWEAPDDTPALPEVGQLALLLSSLFQASRASGRQHSHCFSNGLQVTVATRDGDAMLLGRKDSEPSPEEAATCARECGWTRFSTSWIERQGAKHLVVRPESPPEPEEPPPQDVSDDTPSSAAIRAVLHSPGPWVNHLLSPGMQVIRRAALDKMERPELIKEWTWATRHWPEAAAEAFKQQADRTQQTPIVHTLTGS